MTLSQEQLEWIVAEVVRRLRAGGAMVTTPQPPATISALVLEERLVTLETLYGKLDRVTQVQVQPRSIVTPAVVDLLKEKKIQLIRQ